MDWKKELENKFNQLKKEEKNESQSVSQSRRDNIRSGNSSSISASTSNPNSNNGSGSSSLLRRGISTQARAITKDERRNILMITREAALDDLEKLEKEATNEDGRLIVKVAKVIVKVLATIRSNQLLTDEDKKRIKEARANRKPEVK
jgi:hypothetical protein